MVEGDDGRVADRRRAGNGSEVRVGDPFEERRPEFQLLFRQLVGVAVRNPDVGNFRAKVRNFDDCIRRELALDGCVPLLRVAGPE